MSLLAAQSRVVTPFAAGVQPGRSSLRPSRAAVQCAAGPREEAPQASRREAILRLAGLPALFAAAPALALIPNDADEELIQKLEASRKARLAAEKDVEKDFARKEGFVVDRSTGKELIAVQRAVARLSQSGAALEAGDAKKAADTLSDGWLGPFESAGRDLSQSAAAKQSLAGVLSSVQGLQNAAKSGDVAGAKGSFVVTVDAFTAWVSAAGLQASVKGL